MRRFFLGVLTGLLAVVVGAGAVLLSASRPGDATPARPQPPPTAAPPQPPRDLRAGETWLRTVELDSDAVVTPDGGFVDVDATGSDVRVGPQGLRVGTLRLEATLPFAAAARQIGQGVQLYAAGDGRAGVRRTATFLGREVTVRATGTVSARGGQLVIQPEYVDLDGPQWVDAALSAVARNLVTVRHTVRGLPRGMRLTSVTVVDEGFHAVLDGTDVVLVPSSAGGTPPRSAPARWPSLSRSPTPTS